MRRAALALALLALVACGAPGTPPTAPAQPQATPSAPAAPPPSPPATIKTERPVRDEKGVGTVSWDDAGAFKVGGCSTWLWRKGAPEPKDDGYLLIEDWRMGVVRFDGVVRLVRLPKGAPETETFGPGTEHERTFVDGETGLQIEERYRVESSLGYETAAVAGEIVVSKGDARETIAVEGVEGC